VNALPSEFGIAGIEYLTQAATQVQAGQRVACEPDQLCAVFLRDDSASASRHIEATQIFQADRPIGMLGKADHPGIHRQGFGPLNPSKRQPVLQRRRRKPKIR
jgi:hypothetical protein